MNDRSVRAEDVLERGGASHCSSTTKSCAGGSIPKWGVIVSAPPCVLPSSEDFPEFTRYGAADIGRRCRSGSTQIMG